MSNSIGNNQPVGWSCSEIESLDLKSLRNSDVFRSNYPNPVCDNFGLLFIPIVGWLALAILKLHYVMKHNAAEKIMSERKFDTCQPNEKVPILLAAIKAAGSLAWQYQLELARVQLLDNKSHLAAHALSAALESAAVFANHKQYADAYNAYNEVMFYQKHASACRKHQSVLVAEMREQPEGLCSRGVDIVSAEGKLHERLMTNAQSSKRG